MKIVKAQGGLGNQLFGLAFARSVADLSGEDAALDLSPFRTDRYGHRFSLGQLAAQMALDTVVRPFLGHRAVGALMRHAPPWSFVTEDRPPQDISGLRRLARRGAYFDGYWQNEAYIADPEFIRRTIRDFIEGRGGRAQGHDLVIHYRTYKEEAHAARRRVPGSDFFAEAIAEIERRNGATRDIALVSDDLDAAMDRLGVCAARLVPVPTEDPYQDMSLMFAARGLVLCNSSFSWWGGFCSDAMSVIYPKPDDFFHYPTPAARFTVI
jgi:hypothetical protein